MRLIKFGIVEALGWLGYIWAKRPGWLQWMPPAGWQIMYLSIALDERWQIGAVDRSK